MLLQADARAIPLQDETVQCVVTSPPYWGLRDYGVEGQLGLEATPEEYVAHMVAVFREVRRVLRPDGTLWLNLGDSYAASRSGPVGQNSTLNGGRHSPEESRRAKEVAGRPNSRWTYEPWGIKPKDLLMMPSRVAIALCADGWVLRSEIIWSKPNPMPENVTDRPTVAHEKMFLLSKRGRYFYDAEAIKVPVSPSTHARISQASLQEQQGGPKQDAYETQPGHDRRPSDIVKSMGRKPGVNPKAAANAPGSKQNESFSAAVSGPVSDRNARTVWTIATQPYPGAHYATYPEKLVEPCIKAGSSPKACGVCAAPWERVTGEPIPAGGRESGNKERQIAASGERGRVNTHMGSGFPYTPTTTPTTGRHSTCEHDDDSGSCLVLDPFNGSGTTGRVALQHGRRYVGVDVSREYLVGQASHRLGIAAIANIDIERSESEQQLRMAL